MEDNKEKALDMILRFKRNIPKQYKFVDGVATVTDNQLWMEKARQAAILHCEMIIEDLNGEIYVMKSMDCSFRYQPKEFKMLQGEYVMIKNILEGYEFPL